MTRFVRDSEGLINDCQSAVKTSSDVNRRSKAKPKGLIITFPYPPD
jgi:hypothetical protein